MRRAGTPWLCALALLPASLALSHCVSEFLPDLCERKAPEAKKGGETRKVKQQPLRLPAELAELLRPSNGSVIPSLEQLKPIMLTMDAPLGG
ncbi:hypothetical protein T492DRAFT_859122 [Pavlovales sp. CCMP2436]|nr:hypothetical protein T492DRAFT_859122 [Pavlovales sp. CCMP2436]